MPCRPICAIRPRSRRPRATPTSVINLVGILFERGRQRFDAVQAFGAEAVALAAAAYGARLIHVSAIGADENAPSHYARSKAMGEKLVLAAVPSAVILRPSVVFGPEDDFFNKFAAIARFSPALPLIGGGHTRFQPVFAGDVASAVAAAIEGRAEAGRRSTSSADREVKSFKELMQFVLATIGAPAPAGADPVRARQAAGIAPAAHAQAAAHARPGRAAAQRQRRVGAKPSARAARSRRSASTRSRWRRSCRPISGGSARPASSRRPLHVTDVRSAATERSGPSQTRTGHRSATIRCPSITNIEDLRQIARRKIPRAIFDYVERGSYDELHAGANRDDLDAIRLRQRVLIDVSRGVARHSTMLGEPVSMPIALAPTGLMGLVHGDGEMLAARAAEAAGIRFCQSTMSICTIEDVRSVRDAAVLVPALRVPRPRLQRIDHRAGARGEMLGAVRDGRSADARPAPCRPQERAHRSAAADRPQRARHRHQAGAGRSGCCSAGARPSAMSRPISPAASA